MSRKFLRLRITSKIFNKFNLQTRHFFFVCLFYLSVQSLHIKKDQIPRKCFILFGRGIYRYGDICEELTKFSRLNFAYYEASIRENASADFTTISRIETVIYFLLVFSAQAGYTALAPFSRTCNIAKQSRLIFEPLYIYSYLN